MKKKILIVIISVCVLIISAFGVYFLLGQFGQSKTEEEEATTTLLPASVMETLEGSSLSGLEGYERQDMSGSGYGIAATSQGRDYSVSVVTDDAISYQKYGDPRQSIDQTEYANARQQTNDYFASQGLQKLDGGNETIDQYAGRGVICQANFAESGVPTVLYTCVSDEALNEEYEQVEELLDTYRATGRQVVDFDVASRTSHQRDGIEGSVLHLSPQTVNDQNSGAQYLFGAVDGNWEFVADLTNGTSLGKVNTTPEADEKITDPKWDNVLYELLHGGSKE